MKQHLSSKWILFALMTIAIVSGMYSIGNRYVFHELNFVRARNAALHTDLLTTLNRLEAQRNRAIMAEREADVVRHANALLRESERRRQDEIAALEADLAFYRRLGGANGSQAALAIHHMELQATGSPRVYRINLTLTQNLRWAAAISGRIHLGLDGIQNGAARHLDDRQLLADTAHTLNFKFKYFQQLERLITLPVGFEPVRLTVSLRSGSLRSAVENAVEWNSLFNHPESAVSENQIPALNPGD